ncbi:DUF21 domain-containing protein [Pseudomaricurvus alcaniphilus]|uniref:CNNM domain-containing protein n=1 Tax=Pseudomaricurvus alcaniphilus TaxID=1166482 RepID=UPI00140A069F|nr:CNNM domain-containing protein [Pseudomaricurvus alcaniphilus]NHN38652.1 DUF21 domain-containing protein [Pseudomaricurvus alcaniphilus]
MPTNDASTDIALLTAYVLLALGFSFLCSIAEAVLLSITPSYIEGQKAKRPNYAALLQQLKMDNVDRSLAAILTLNTIAHTAGAVAAGAKASEVFGSAWFGLFSAVMTLMILFFSEIIPKTIGAIYWKKLAKPTAFFVRALVTLLLPLVWASERLTKFISHGQNGHFISRHELMAMTRVGEESGHIKDNESRVIHNLLQLNTLTAQDIMTPRTVISALPEDTTVLEAVRYLVKKPFSRLPLYCGDTDNISGFVLRDDILLQHILNNETLPLVSLKRDLMAVPAKARLSLLLERLLQEQRHIALVVDEFGGTKGLVTLEDLLETLMGVEIIDERDKIEDMQVLARKLWKKRARKLGIDTTDTDELE